MICKLRFGFSMAAVVDPCSSNNTWVSLCFIVRITKVSVDPCLCYIAVLVLALIVIVWLHLILFMYSCHPLKVLFFFDGQIKSVYLCIYSIRYVWERCSSV